MTRKLSAVFFFFSSRRRHTRCSRDWSSDVCSSDLLEEICATVNRKLEIVAVRDRVLRTSFDAVSAKYATSVIDVVDGGVSFIHADSLFGRSRIVGGHNVDAFRRTRSGTKITGDAFLAALFVNVQQVLPAIPRL